MTRTALALIVLAAVPTGASAATQWLPPGVLSAQQRGAGAPAVAGNDDGRAIAAWAGPTGVMTSLRTPGGPWYAPVRIPGSGRGATQVAASMTTAGAAAVTWVQGGRVRAALRPPRRRFLPAVAVSPAGNVASAPAVSLGGACAPLVAWATQPSTGGRSYIQAACGSGTGAFAAARMVSASDEDGFTPAVAASRGGSVVVWRSDQADQHRVRAAQRQRDGSFTAPADVSQASTSVFVDPSVAIAPSGDAVAAWTIARGQDLIAQSASLPVGGAWSRADDLSRTGGVARGAQVAVDSQGNATATWVRGGVVQVVARAAGQPWGAGADLSDGTATAGVPHLAVSGSGAALITWPTGSGSTYVAQAALRPAGGQFGPAATISDPAAPAIAPAGAIGDDGIAPVAWQWTTPGADPASAPSGIGAATGFAGSSQPGPAILVDLRARPATVAPGQRITVTFGLSQPSRVRLVVTPAGGGAERGALTVSGADGANAIVLEGGLGGASLGRGRWRITATPSGGAARSLVLVVR